MVKKVITNLDSSKGSCLDCIPVMVLMNCKPKLSYILAELLNKCLKQSCFPDYWEVSLVVPVFKNVGERSTTKNYAPCLLSVSKVFKACVHYFHQMFISSPNDSSSKTIKNAFYFI